MTLTCPHAAAAMTGDAATAGVPSPGSDVPGSGVPISAGAPSGAAPRAGLPPASVVGGLFDPLPGSALPPVTLGPPVFDDVLGLWRVTRYDDVRSVFSDPSRFSSVSAVLAHTPFRPAALRALARVHFALPPTLPTNDTASHAALRAALLPRFTRPAIKQWVPWITELTDARIAEVTETRVDLAQVLARDIPPRVFFHLMGLPATSTTVGEPPVDMPTFKRWARDSLELFWGFPSPERQLALAEDAAEFYTWIWALVDHVRAHPGDDAMSLLASLTDLPTPSGRLSDVELRAALYFLLIAGQETTCQLITTCFHALLRRPDLWAACQDPDTANALVVEVLRAHTPVSSWRRRALVDTTVGGVDVRAGDDLLLELGASGHDPTFYPDGDTLLPGRPRSRSHHAFGFGIHRCLGAVLAEVEASVIIHRAAVAWPELRLDDAAPEWIDWLSFRAPRTAWATGLR